MREGRAFTDNKQICLTLGIYSLLLHEIYIRNCLDRVFNEILLQTLSVNNFFNQSPQRNFSASINILWKGIETANRWYFRISAFKVAYIQLLQLQEIDICLSYKQFFCLFVCLFFIQQNVTVIRVLQIQKV